RGGKGSCLKTSSSAAALGAGSGRWSSTGPTRQKEPGPEWCASGPEWAAPGGKANRGEEFRRATVRLVFRSVRRIGPDTFILTLMLSFAAGRELAAAAWRREKQPMTTARFCCQQLLL